MTATELTDRQRREVEHYAQKEWLEDIDLDILHQPQFGPWNPYWFMQDLVRRERQGSDQRLLTFGCGRGRESLQYAHMGFRVSGFDISEHCLRNAEYLAKKYQLQDRVDFSIQAAESLNFPSASFDFVSGQNVLHHLDIPRAVAELRRVLKPGGLAVFKEPWDTPVRTWVRRHPPISWLAPVGAKNLWDGSIYNDTPDEKQLNGAQVEAIRRIFPQCRLYRWRVLAKLAIFTRTKTAWQRLDWALFKVCPPLRWLGDEIVLVLRKTT